MMYFRASVLLVPNDWWWRRPLASHAMRTVVYVGSGTEATSVNHVEIGWNPLETKIHSIVAFCCPCLLLPQPLTVFTLLTTHPSFVLFYHPKSSATCLPPLESTDLAVLAAS